MVNKFKEYSDGVPCEDFDLDDVFRAIEEEEKRRSIVFNFKYIKDGVVEFIDLNVGDAYRLYQELIEFFKK